MKPALEPCIEEVNYDDLFELDEQNNNDNGSFDISDDVLEKLAQRVAELIQGGTKDEVDTQ